MSDDNKLISRNNETNLKFILKIGDGSREFYSYTALFGDILKCKLIQTLVDNEKEDIYRHATDGWHEIKLD